LVTDLPADFDVFGQAVDTQMLTNANAAIAKTIVDAKGDIIAATAADTVSRLAVGANGTVLTADSAEATGMKWAAVGGGGKVLQVVYASYAVSTSSSSSTYADTGLTATITPSSATSKVLVILAQNGIGKTGANANTDMGHRLMKGATTLAQLAGAATYTNVANDTVLTTIAATYLDEPATTSAVTYKTQFNSGNNTAAVTVQRDSSVSSFTLLEIGA